MKKFFLISMLGLLLACCTKEHEVNGGEVIDDPNAPAVTSYLTINLRTVGGISSRADNYNEETGGTYTDGSESENKVNMIRFFFFDNQDKAAPVWKLKGSSTSDDNGTSKTSEYESFIDWYPSADNNNNANHDELVEKIVSATLGINTVVNSMPTQVFAVVNPNQQIITFSNSKTTSTDNYTLKGPSLTDLKGLANDYLTDLTNYNFVMSNSVYVDDKDNEVKYTKELTENDFHTSAEDAAGNPVTIYVERVVARLDLEISVESTGKTAENGKPMYKTKPIKEDDTSTPADGIDDSGTKTQGSYEVDGKDEEIYVTLLGWNVTTTPNKSNLVKEISADWSNTGDNTLFGNDLPWNAYIYHRSFWAINPSLSSSDYLYGKFNKDDSADNHNPADGNVFPAEGKAAPVYMQENAGLSSVSPSTDNPTNVIIAAQLVNSEGKPFELAEWAYKKYTLENLKKVFADQTLRQLYKKTAGTDNTSYKQIEPTDITFKTFKQAYGSDNTDDNGRYYVYPVVVENTDNTTSIQWALKDEDTGNYAEHDVDWVNTYMRDRINHVMVWNEGRTYYYFDIRHLATKNSNKPGEFGVVRNHIYAANIISLSGLGTPVYDPNEEIRPEIPESDESIITAEVKILQWRIVEDEYDIQWPN